MVSHSNKRIYKCPKCGTDLRTLSTYITSLEAEIVKISKVVAILRKEIAHLRGGFVASSRRHKFHRLECYWAQFLINSPSRVEYSTHQEAIDAGCKPCGTCCA
jgi:hypothetical protein